MLNNLSRNRRPEDKVHQKSASVVAEKKVDKSSPSDLLLDLDMTVSENSFLSQSYFVLTAPVPSFVFQPSKRSNDDEVAEGKVWILFNYKDNLRFPMSCFVFSSYIFRTTDHFLQRWSSVRRDGELNPIERIQFHPTRSKKTFI